MTRGSGARAMRRRVAILLASTSLALGAAVPSVQAADFEFVPASGDFDTPGNWNPNDPADGFTPPPGAGDDANFADQSVDVTNATTHGTFILGHTTFNVSGSYDTGSVDDDAMGSGADSSLTVRGDGTFTAGSYAVFSTTVDGGNLTITGPVGGRSVAVTNGGTLTTPGIFNLTLDGANSKVIGTGAFRIGTAMISNGGQVMAQGDATIGDTGFPFTIDGANTKFEVAGVLRDMSAGGLAVTNGATVTSDSAVITTGGGNNLTTPGMGSTVGGSSKWTITNGLSLGSSGTLTLLPGGTLTAASVTFFGDPVFNGAGGGQLIVQGGQATISGQVTGSGDGSGSVIVSDAGTLSTEGVSGDNFYLVSGAASLWTNDGDFVMAQAGINPVFGGELLQVLDGGRLTNTGDLIVAQGAGTDVEVQVSRAGLLGSRNGMIGVGAGSTGEVDVGGAGSQWSNTGDLTVGGQGTGTMRISGEGALAGPTAVTDVNAVIAASTVSHGDVHVDGGGATWMNSGTLTVGKAGTATLEIGTGGQVSSTDAVVGDAAGSNGQVSLTDAGSLWQINGGLIIGAAGTGAVTLDAGAKLHFTGQSLVLGRDATGDGTLTLNDPNSVFDFTGPIQIGLNGTGKLALGRGFKIDQGSSALTLGARSTSTGTLQVSDANSKFTTTGMLTIGSLGKGHLIVEMGGAMASGPVIIGDQAQSIGDAVVRDADSRWDITGDLTIGNFGTGQVTVKDGGTLSLQAGSTITLGKQKDSEGTLTFDGTGAHILPTDTGGLIIGDQGNGTLEVKNGASISLSGRILGQKSGSSGTISVDGATAGDVLEPGTPSKLTLTGPTLIVGGQGSGFLDITDGGQVVARQAAANGSSSLDVGGNGANGNGRATISGTGSLLDAQENIVIVGGISGAAGELDLKTGGSADVGTLLLGDNILAGGGGSGALRLDGSGTTLTAGDVTMVDHATLAITGGAKAFIGSKDALKGLEVAGGTPANAMITVSGTGSLLRARSPDGLGVGFTLGSATLAIDSGGTVDVDQLVSTKGVITVDGAGSRLLSGDGNPLTIQGGSLTVSNGASVTGAELFIGGSGFSGSFGPGDGEVHLKSNGQLQATSVLLAAVDGSTGLLDIDGSTFSPSSVTVGVAGTGTVTIEDAGTLAPSGSISIGLGVGAEGSKITASGGSTLSASTLSIDRGGSLSLSDSSTASIAGTATLGFTGDASKIDIQSGASFGAATLLVGSTAPGVITVGDGALVATTIIVGSGSSARGSSITVTGPSTSSAATLIVDPSGSFLLQGGGTAQIDQEIDAFGGTFDVRGGAANIGGGSLPATGTLRVGPGGILRGDSVTGNVLNAGGRVAPGHSPGTLTIDGDYVQAPDGTLVIATTPSAAALLAVTGKATLAGTLQFVAQEGAYVPLTTYTILTAQGGIAGSFGTVTDNFAFVTPIVTINGNAIEVELDPKTTSTGLFVTAADTGNQMQVAQALDTIPMSNPLIIPLLGQTKAGAQQAFDALSGEIDASLQTGLIDQSRLVRQAVLGQTLDFPFAAGGPVVAADGSRVWTQLLGSQGSFGATADTAALSDSAQGFLGGIETTVNSTTRLGIFGGETESGFGVPGRGSTAAVDTYDLGAYGASSFGPITLRGGAAWSHYAIDTTRSVTFPGFAESETAHYGADAGQVFGEVSYRVDAGPVALEPFGGLAWVHMNSGDFSEQGGVAALDGRTNPEDRGYTTLGLRAGTSTTLPNGMTLGARASLAWQHALGDDGPTSDLAFHNTPTAAFTVSGAPASRDAAVLGAGLDLNLSDTAALGISYDASLGERDQSQSMQASFHLHF